MFDNWITFKEWIDNLHMKMLYEDFKYYEKKAWTGLKVPEGYIK